MHAMLECQLLADTAVLLVADAATPMLCSACFNAVALSAHLKTMLLTHDQLQVCCTHCTHSPPTSNNMYTNAHPAAPANALLPLQLLPAC
jgi:hypothetical protein